MAVLQESLRLFGSVPSIARVTSGEVEIGGYLIPSNTEVFILTAILHRDPAYFPQPDKFDPDRFAAKNVQVWGFSKYLY